ncbi:MAG: RecQ family ATP-dependent DNA helicase [Treponemataceae bacterium]|nr:RecQ family ATP-dependent DNA helicase [Treponemataceae bacterium]
MNKKIRADDDQLFDYDPVLAKAQKAFGITYLYPWQRLVIANILEGSEEPVRQIVLLPTGAGKSMCFMVPAMILDGPTMIMYPLLALMNDQERRLVEGGIDCVTFKGGQNDDEREENFRRLAAGARVILANPEVLQNDTLVERLKTVGIAHIAIDEAHCVAEWGDTFRPAYLTLGSIIARLQVPRVTAFTATASPEVLSRVNEVLFGGSARVVRSEADRPNIHYYVHYAACKERAVLELAEREEKPLLVFCSSRKKAERMALLLLEQEKELHPDHTDTVRFYHAGLEREEKTAVEKWFYPRKDAFLASTCAFGMGVDKKDIKTVIHLDVPATAEAFIQEAGRGGRDGSVAKSFLVWGPEDTARAEKDAVKLAAEHVSVGLPDKTLPVPRRLVMAQFALQNTCRRQILLDAMGAEQAACRGCDVCQGLSPSEALDMRTVWQFLRRHGNQFTKAECARVLELRQVIPGYTEEEYLLVLSRLIEKGMVKKGKYLCTGRLYASGAASAASPSAGAGAGAGLGAFFALGLGGFFW